MPSTTYIAIIIIIFSIGLGVLFATGAYTVRFLRGVASGERLAVERGIGELHTLPRPPTPPLPPQLDPE